MVGTSDIPFSGTFDGKGHTLTVNYQNNTSDLWAPFRFVKNATIRNLHVNGTIKTTQQFAAGIVAKVVKDGNVSIENCHSSVTIERESTSTSAFYAYYAGFVAKNDNSSLTITGCIFDGTLKAQKSSITRKGCGFVGSNYGTVSITNSLFKPSSILNIKSDHSYTFVLTLMAPSPSPTATTPRPSAPRRAPRHTSIPLLLTVLCLLMSVSPSPTAPIV
jgi:hypothetical protein